MKHVFEMKMGKQSEYYKFTQIRRRTKKIRPVAEP